MDNEAKDFSPPYNVAWTSFLNTLIKVTADLPNKIDRSYLGNQNGSTQTYLISAFKGFNLISEDNAVQDTLRDFAGPEKTKELIGILLQKYYGQVVALGTTNATMGELNKAFEEMFPRVTGESRVKAIRFYLSAAEHAGITVSPFWKSTKKGTTSTAPKKPRKVKATPGTNGSSNGGTPPPPPAVDTTSSMKKAYFDLLLKKAGESSDDLSSDLLDRIEKLIGDEP